MLNRQLTIVIAAFLVLGCLGRGELPESLELEAFLFSTKGQTRGELVTKEYLYADLLDEARIEKLRTLVSKVGANGPELTDGDFISASAALRLLGVAKAPGLVEAAIPFIQISRYSVDRTAAEVMAATGSEAAVEHLEAAFQKNMKTWLGGDPWAVTKIGGSLRCFAINGTPKARAAYERSIKQVAEAVKTTGNTEDQKWERKHIANLWADVQNDSSVEKATKTLPDPSEARRVGPAVPREQPNRDALSNSASKSNASAPVAAVGKADNSAPLADGWALWGGIVATLAVIAGFLVVRSRSNRLTPK